MGKLDRKTAIITGTARGIGAAVAKRLAADNFAVAVVDVDEAACKPVVEEIEAHGGWAKAFGVDVSDEQAVVKEIPVARGGLPADIAHAASFFASEGAGYVSGQVLYVAGGPKA